MKIEAPNIENASTLLLETSTSWGGGDYSKRFFESRCHSSLILVCEVVRRKKNSLVASYLFSETELSKLRS